MNFYKHFLGDYARDTADLSLLEHGAYRVLLDHYYAQRGNMGADLGKLHLVCKARTPAERRAVETVADRFFAVNGDGRRHNRRADREIVEATEKGAKAKASAEARWGKASGDAPDLVSDMRSHSERNASHSQRPEESKASSASQRKSATPSQTGLDCPKKKLIDLYHELLPMCTRMEKLTRARATVMAARWRDEALPNREKHRGYATVDEGLAYWRRFFAWCAESKFLTGNAPGRDGGPPFVASLPWLMKDENFAKVIEGSYHR